MSHRRAYSLLELVTAVAVLAVVLLGSAAALHYGMQASHHGGLTTEAGNHARTLMEIMLAENRAFATAGLPDSSSGINDAAGVTRELNAPPFQASSYQLVSQQRFTRHIEVRNYALAGDAAAVKLWKDEVRQVAVSVHWNEGGRPHSLTLVSMCRRPR